MTATATGLPALMTQTVALLLLDEAHGNLLRPLAERDDCGDCKASAGWCGPCHALFLASELIGLALAEARFCQSDRDARKIASDVIDLLSDKGRYGDAGEVAFFGVASERAA